MYKLYACKAFSVAANRTAAGFYMQSMTCHAFQISSFKELGALNRL